MRAVDVASRGHRAADPLGLPGIAIIWLDTVAP
jgi:hypothetical protein